MAKESGIGTLVGLAIAGVGVYFVGDLFGWWGGAPPATTTATATVATTPPAGGIVPANTPMPTTAPTTPAATPTSKPPATTSGQVLTLADAAVFPYSGSITAAQMNAIHDQLVTELQGGQIPQIAGNSVLAYMLGWGGATSGATKTTVGDTYKYDGTNWNLQSSAGSKGVGAYPRTMVFANRGNYVRRGRAF